MGVFFTRLRETSHVIAIGSRQFAKHHADRDMGRLKPLVAQQETVSNGEASCRPGYMHNRSRGGGTLV